MIKKIGKFLLNLFFVFLCIGFNLTPGQLRADTVELKIADHNGNELKKVASGVPFNLELIIEGSDSNVDRLKIDNLEKYVQKNIGTTTSINNINGKMSVQKTYQYELRIDREGSFPLGPVYVNDVKYDKI